MTTRHPKIRAAMADDAEAIGELARQFAVYLRLLGDTTNFQFDAGIYLRDGFGPNPAFSGLVAEIDGQVIGYLIYYSGYDVDRAIKLLHIADLYVHEKARKNGAGRALMREAANICRQKGGTELQWAVFTPNKLAAEFYERLGAEYINDLKYMRWKV